ncbi:MAG: ABC transporter ATP-binding protein, partial [Gemmatimonadota bacterium]|nr:ABC transporter ATP-binding protein [Gemmatimonadota bacterium]
MTQPALQVSDVTVSLGGNVVLDRVSLTLEAGDFLGLIGPNGGGKTTLLRVMMGILKPESGSVRIFGLPPGKARGIVGYVPQYARFDASYPIDVMDVVLMGRLSKGKRFRRTTPTDREIAEGALESMSLMHLKHRPVGDLSGGELQRVLIARALAVEPQVLFLDEPTASVDTRMGRSVYELLEDISQDRTVVLVSHDVGVISRHVKTVACMSRELHYHHTKELPPEVIEKAYGCPVELLGHGHPHRVLEGHEHA